MNGRGGVWNASSKKWPSARGRFPPLSQQPLQEVKYRPLSIRTTVGEVVIKAAYGRDPGTGQWLFPIRQQWGLGSRQTMSPTLQEKVCFTATMTLSYERAAAVAGKWGRPIDDATIHRHVQQAGQRAESLTRERVERALSPRTRGEVVRAAKENAPTGEFSLVLMLDGWMIRERGGEWGLKPPETKGDRVGWHEVKSAIVFRADQRAQTQSGRPLLLTKFYVSWRGDPEELGRRLYAEALRRGLNQARRVYVVADGGVWIWNIAQDRFPEAVGVLDFYHASEHLWAVAHKLFGEGSAEARAWVEPLLHQLNHGGEAGVLRQLEDLLTLCAEWDEAKCKPVQREVNYFQNHREHLHYQRVREAGCPNGSGAMESTCSQFQNRFKRTGQFWNLPGENNLMALELARRNEEWDEIWWLDSEQ